MTDELQLALELVELGDAKEQTKGFVTGPASEDVPTKMFDRPL